MDQVRLNLGNGLAAELETCCLLLIKGQLLAILHRAVRWLPVFIGFISDMLSFISDIQEILFFCSRDCDGDTSDVGDQ
jgi:hypothetical protein